MATVEIEQRWIDKFRDNLGIIRKVAGWTTQNLPMRSVWPVRLSPILKPAKPR